MIPWTHSTDEFDKMWHDEEKTGPEFIPDIIETMFAKQREQMEKYEAIYSRQQVTGNPVPDPDLWGDLYSPVTQASLRENIGYVVEELYEAIGLLKNKPWKQSLKGVDVEHFMEEIADAWHFFIQFHIVAGLTPTDVFEQYFKKALENQDRRTSGY